MRIGIATQQPEERFSYTVDYSEAMDATDFIVSAVAVVAPSGLVVANTSYLPKSVRFWVSGGSSPTTYKVTITVTTANDWVFQDEILFKIKEL